MLHGIYDKLVCPYCETELTQVEEKIIEIKLVTARSLSFVGQRHYKITYHCPECSSQLEPSWEEHNNFESIYHWDIVPKEGM